MLSTPHRATEGPRKLAGKFVVRVYLLDNSMKTLLVEEDATAGVHTCFRFASVLQRVSCADPGHFPHWQEVTAILGDQIGFASSSYIHCYALHECHDGITSMSAHSDVAHTHTSAGLHVNASLSGGVLCVPAHSQAAIGGLCTNRKAHGHVCIAHRTFVSSLDFSTN